MAWRRLYRPHGWHCKLPGIIFRFFLRITAVNWKSLWESRENTRKVCWEELITETLLEDDRILGVRDFSQQFRGEKAEASFTLETTLGTVSMTWDQEERT